MSTQHLYTKDIVSNVNSKRKSLIENKMQYKVRFFIINKILGVKVAIKIFNKIYLK